MDAPIAWFWSRGSVFRDLLPGRKPAQSPSQSSHDLLIVRRGMSPAFYFFCRLFAKEHGLTVVQDRRAGDRRHQRAIPTIDRRRFDRRKAWNDWEKADFLVIGDLRKHAWEERES